MISDLATQVEAYETVLMPFSFMFKLDEITDTEIREGCAQLMRKYVNDLDDDFANECIHFKFFMTDINAAIEKDRQCTDKMNEEDATMKQASEGTSRLTSKPSRMLKHTKSNSLDATFPNLEVALRIFESIAVANATGERSFSGLKRIKSPLRSLLGQEKMNDLATLFINNDITNLIDNDDIKLYFGKSTKIVGKNSNFFRARNFNLFDCNILQAICSQNVKLGECFNVQLRSGG